MNMVNAPLMREETDLVHALVVEDDAAMRTFVSNVLVTSGFAPHRLDKGVQVELALVKWNPKLIVLDLSLGDSDAVDVIRTLERLRYGGHVLLISGHDSVTLESVLAIGQRRGLSMLTPLRKPMRVELLREQLALAMGTDTESISDDTLEAGLRNNWLELWYQPKIDLASGLFCGSEALIRLRHPEKGILLPQAFLPPPGDPLYRALTSFISRRALADWELFAARGMTNRIAINVPASVLQRTEFVDDVRRNLPSSESFPGLIVEITEDEAISDLDLAREIAVQLSLYNIQVSIDDFGAGYSSLARLTELPFAEIKLDRQFVHGCSSDDRKRSMCRAVIELARRFSLTAVAEGVETKDDLRILVELGFPVAQGFLFARPMPADNFLQLVVSRARTA